MWGRGGLGDEPADQPGLRRIKDRQSNKLGEMPRDLSPSSLGRGAEFTKGVSSLEVRPGAQGSTCPAACDTKRDGMGLGKEWKTVLRKP